MKYNKIANALMVSSSLLMTNCNAQTNRSDNAVATHHAAADNTRVQVALLLDTSNSMDGLIDQAKSRLWNIINTLTTLKYHGKTPKIEIALYEYGNDGLSSAHNYIRQVTPMTTDLDLISEKLFSLSTNGGEEYCGAVIQEAVKKLDWGGLSSDMKLVYIAGNESFAQGNVSYKESIADALKKGISVNTIFCGGNEDGIREQWKNGALVGHGKYFNIDANKKVRYIETPYDDKLEACNVRMNKTYISYGSVGFSKKANQVMQDANAESVSKSYSVERTVSKSKEAYKNESWDLVDKAVDNKAALKNIDKSQLDAEYQHKTDKELEAVIAQKAKERADIQKEIEVLAKQRQAYIDAQTKTQNTADDLGAAINKSILDLAASKGYVIVK